MVTSSHVGGNPIRVATHRGLSTTGEAARRLPGVLGLAGATGPPGPAIAASWSGSVGVGSPVARVRHDCALGPFQSRDEGLRHAGSVPRTASVSVVPGCMTPVAVVCRAALTASPAVGVGQCRRVAAVSVSAVPRDRRAPEHSESSARGVGHDEDARPLVRGAHVARAYNRPFRVIPARGQAPENLVDPSNKEPWDVLHHNVAGS